MGTVFCEDEKQLRVGERFCYTQTEAELVKFFATQAGIRPQSLPNTASTAIER